MKKLRRSSKKRIILYCVSIVLLLVIFLMHQSINDRTYEYIEKPLIYENLLLGTGSNYVNNASIDCDYHDILSKDVTMSINVIDEDVARGYKVREGGEYSPDCKPKFSTAIIVPYRDRPEQLKEFVVYMHTYLQSQNIHYKVYIVEQLDSFPYNRAKLLNIGAKIAMDAGWPCLVLHDIDLLPLKPANLYACTKQPRHMSSIINTFRFVLPYLNTFGGPIAMASQQFKDINGMSNKYFGSGGEDEDFYVRIEINGLKICRFDPDITVYHMQTQRNTDKKGQYIDNLLESAKERMKTDGLNSLKYTHIGTVLHPLFTHIMVDL